MPAEISVSRIAFGSPHCPVCPLFLGQSVPVTLTDRGYVLFCEECALGHGEVMVHAHDSTKLQLRVDAADEEEASDEE